jgi:hypothetical protein
MAKSKKKPSELDNLNLTDGKVNEDPDIKKVKELEEILGIKKVNPFGTYNLEVFQEKLSEMTALDMQKLCERVGIFASGSRKELKDKLLREFKAVGRGTISMTTESPSVKLDPNNPLHKKTLKILGEL